MNHRLQPPLDQHEGLSLLSARDALLKGVLESELPVALIAGDQFGPFAPFFHRASQPTDAALLLQHGTRVAAVNDPHRAVTLAGYTAAQGRHALALIGNAELDESMQSLTALARRLSPDRGAVGLVLEDNPQRWPASCPRRAAIRLGIPAIEATSIENLRDHIEDLLRISRASSRPAALIVHRSLLRSVQTVHARANRIAGADAALSRRRRRARVGRGDDHDGALRQARMLELNQSRALPNPGERVPLGFFTVGVADLALQHVIAVLRLYGRLPVVHLRLVSPVDDAAVGRLLRRCEKVIVLEPRPGTIESQILAVAEQLRHHGEPSATVWGRVLPPDEQGRQRGLAGDHDLHASILVRRLRDLFADLRPEVDLDQVLQPEPPELPMRLPPRGEELGAEAAINVVRRLLSDLQRWLDRRQADEAPAEPIALVMSGADAPETEGRTVYVEMFDQSRFVREAASAIGQAARDPRPSLLLVFALDPHGDINLQRFAHAVTPGARSERVQIEEVNLSDLPSFRAALRRVVLEDSATIVVIKDGPPAQFNVTAIEQSFQEVDALGFQPTLRLTRPTELACAVRPSFDESIEERLSSSDPNRLRTEVTLDRASRRPGGPVQVRLRPRLEQVEVIRVRPPTRPWRRLFNTSIAPPSPLHGQRPVWRAHLAGYRSDGPGVAAMILCDAARRLGYAVHAVHEPAPIGFGRRAWAQVLFTNPRGGEGFQPQVGSIPFGEADVLMGLDAVETLRALGPDASLRIAHSNRTFVVANLGVFADDVAGGEPMSEMDFVRAIRGVTRPDVQRVGDFSRACRVWLQTDRLTDIALLGATYQMGLVPVSLDAIEDAVEHAENCGCGRAMEGFEFGRHLAEEPRLFVRPRIERAESTDRMLRRLVLSLRRSRFRGAARAERFDRLITRALNAMPGLMDTEPGRQARRDFVSAMYQCLLWGGEGYAERYGNLITRLYETDRGERGRDITRNAVLPLAEAMLVRDAIYIATMSMSSMHRRRLRAMLGVRPARGDRIERRFLTRLDLMFGRRRLRMDVRTGSGTILLLSLLRRVMPHRLRGSRRQRDVRSQVTLVVDRALEEMSERYEQITLTMHRLHQAAVSGQLQRMTPQELQRLVREDESASSSAPPVERQAQARDESATAEEVSAASST